MGASTVFILFGVNNSSEQKEKGRFFCPVCHSEQKYLRKTRKRSLTIFFIPVYKMGEGGEHVECLGCGSTLPTSVLKRTGE